MTFSGRASGRWWRWAALLLLLLLVLHAGRVALVRSVAVDRPQLALSVWPDHPDALFSLALVGIGTAARQGRAPDQALLKLVSRGARSAPLAAEPLWVAATARMEAGDYDRAERLLRSAVRRHPRAPAARFLLAEVAIRQNRLDLALDELSALERRFPGMSTGFAPALIAFVRQPGALPRAAPVLTRNPPLRAAVLAGLAANAADFPLLVALARPGDEGAPWFRSAADRMLAEGRIGELRQLHARVLPSRNVGGIALSRWKGSASGALFEWRFPKSPGGLAEPVENSPVRLVHYGREETVLAEHLLLLPAGRYRLTDRFAAPVPSGALEWRLRCLAGNRLIHVQSTGGSSRRIASVSSDCPAQALVLVGLAGDIAQTTRAELSEVSLVPAEGEQ